MTRGKQTRSQILEMATRLASLSGLGGLTFGQLAKAVGMSKSGLYAHFSDKNHLQLDVLKRASELFTENVLKPSFKEPRGEPRIRALFDNWMRHVVGDESLPGGSVFIAVATELDDQPGELRNFVQKAQKEVIGHIEKAASIAVDEGHFRQDLDIKLFAWALYSFVLGFHHFKKLLEDPMANQHFEECFNGLLEYAKGTENSMSIIRPVLRAAKSK